MLMATVHLVRVLFRTGSGRFKYHMNMMGLSPSASCGCDAASQTAHHIASECPLHTVDATGTWSCWTLQHATVFATCSVTYRTIDMHRTILNQTHEEES